MEPSLRGNKPFVIFNPRFLFFLNPDLFAPGLPGLAPSYASFTPLTLQSECGVKEAFLRPATKIGVQNLQTKLSCPWRFSALFSPFGAWFLSVSLKVDSALCLHECLSVPFNESGKQAAGEVENRAEGEERQKMWFKIILFF